MSERRERDAENEAAEAAIRAHPASQWKADRARLRRRVREVFGPDDHDDPRPSLAPRRPPD